MLRQAATGITIPGERSHEEDPDHPRAEGRAADPREGGEVVNVLVVKVANARLATCASLRGPLHMAAGMARLVIAIDDRGNVAKLKDTTPGSAATATYAATPVAMRSTGGPRR